MVKGKTASGCPSQTCNMIKGNQYNGYYSKQLQITVSFLYHFILPIFFSCHHFSLSLDKRHTVSTWFDTSILMSVAPLVHGNKST